MEQRINEVITAAIFLNGTVRVFVSTSIKQSFSFVYNKTSFKKIFFKQSGSNRAQIKVSGGTIKRYTEMTG